MEKIIFNHCRFRVADFLHCGDSKDFNYIRNEIDEGVSKCYSVKGEKFKIKCVIRGEDKELVLVMASGSGLKNFIPHLAEKAKASLFKTVRFHTNKNGIRKITELAGFKVEPVETVYRVVL